MISSLYVGASGMIVENQRLSVISNNLANVNTNGFKRDEVTFSNYLYHRGLGPFFGGYPTDPGDFKKLWFDPQNSVVMAYKTYTSFLPGRVEETSIKTNVAIDGDGFFLVSYNGGNYYTRDGSFKLYPDGTLRNSVGARLLGRRSPGAPVEEVRVDPNSEVVITSDGWIESNGNRLFKIEINTFPGNLNNYLQKKGSNLFELKDPNMRGVEQQNPVLLVGYVERSNADVVLEMVKLIDCFRHYEACQRVVTATFEDVTSKTVNDVGRIG